MKVLSVRQPWAWALVNGIKDIENRSWVTPHRGPLLIHAGKAKPRAADLEKVAGLAQLTAGLIALPSVFDLGGIVGAVMLAEMVSPALASSLWHEPGLWGWRVECAVSLPFSPLTGRLGLFSAPAPVGLAERLTRRD